MGRRQWQSQQSSQPHAKCLDIGNDLFLKLLFCEQQKTPVTKIKSCSRTALNQDQLLPFPAGVPSDEGLLIERGGVQGRRIIEDLEMVEVSGDRELQLPEEQSYEVVRLPLACQTVPEENSSNEQLIEKTRYLLVRTLDLDDQTALTQSFQPSVTLNHSFRGPLLRDCSNIPDFCFPEGVQLVGEVIGCGYQVLTFILTQQDNSRVYANCLRFKEKLSTEIVHSLPPNCVDRHLHGRTLLFADRAFCLLSRYAHTQFLHALLEELFRHYLTLHNAHALRYRHQVKSDPCIPLPAHPPAFDVLAAEFIKNYEKGLACAERELGQAQFMKEDIKMEMEWFGRILPFPEAVEDAASLFSPRAVHCLFSVLQVQRIAEVFLALLQEQKVFFVSDSQIVLGYVIQALLSFLYPLRWEHVILPILPQKLLQLLQAPVPLIAGIPTALASDNLICSAKDATVVFLDCNQVIWRERGVEVKEVNHLRQAVKKLRSYQIYSKDHVLQMLLLKEQFFLFRIHEKQCQHLFSAEHIKHIFFETMLLFLQNYNAFYRAPTHLAPVKTCPAPTSPKRSEPSRQSEPPRNEFNFKRDYLIEEFVKAHPKSLQKFMRKFTQCTHFINFIYRYASSSTASHKALIDRALITQRNSTSPLKFPAFRLSQQPPKNSQQINNLRKKVSLQPQHNTTWSPPPKKSEEISTNYSRNLGRYSMKLEDVEIAPDREPSLSQDKKTRGGQICEAITKALTNASHTKRNVIIWTQARVARLKRIFAPRHDKQTEEDKQQGKDEKVQKQEGMQKECKDQ